MQFVLQQQKLEWAMLNVSIDYRQIEGMFLRSSRLTTTRKLATYKRMSPLGEN